MKLKSKIISIDYDEVLFPFLEPLLKELNETHNLNAKVTDIKGWNIESYLPLTRTQVFAPTHNDNFWKRIQPKEDAVWFVDKIIKDGCDIQVVTSSFYKNVKPKIERLLKCFPLEWKNVIITSNKQRIITDVLIDDAPHNLRGGNYIKFLIDMPHNQIDLDKENEMIRVNNLREVYELLQLEDLWK